MKRNYLRFICVTKCVKKCRDDKINEGRTFRKTCWLNCPTPRPTHTLPTTNSHYCAKSALAVLEKIDKGTKMAARSTTIPLIHRDSVDPVVDTHSDCADQSENSPNGLEGGGWGEKNKNWKTFELSAIGQDLSVNLWQFTAFCLPCWYEKFRTGSVSFGYS